MSARSLELRNRITEAAGRPLASAVPKRRVDVPALVAREKRYLQPNTIALVTRVPVLARLWAMHPGAVEQECGQTLGVVQPDRDVDVPMLPGHSTRVEIDRPAPEKPVAHVVA